MSQFTVAIAALALLVGPSLASDPGHARQSKKSAARKVMSNLYLRTAAELDARDRELARAAIKSLTLIISPQPRVAEFMNVMHSARYDSDLQQAREEMHRFWMNNQPSTLTFDRLNGAIGP